MEVRTLFGRHYVNPGDYVWVGLQGSFARKKASRLLPGDEILVRKDGISGITLEQIGAALAKSPGYQEKASALFVKFQGVSLPVFQHALLSGIFERSEMWPSSVTADASFRAQFQSGKPFELSAEQLSEASETIRSRLVSGGVSEPVSIFNIRYNWLQGNVVCPKNARQVAAALEGISPGISVLLGEGFQAAYRGYLAARIGIMRAVSGMLRQQKQGAPGEKRGKGGARASFRPEIAEIIRLFANDLSSTMLSSPVISLGARKKDAPAAGSGGKGSADGGKRHGEEEGIPLFRGIVTESIDGEKIARRKLPDIAFEYNAAEGIALGIIGNIMKDNGQLIGFSGPGEAGGMFIKVKFELSRFLGYREFHLPAMKQRLSDEGLHDAARLLSFPFPGGSEKAAGIANIIGELVLTGRLDAKYGLPRGTLKSFFEYESKLRTFLPTDLLLCLAVEEMARARKNAAKGSRQAVSFRKEEDLMRKIFKSPEIAMAYAEMRKRAGIHEARALLSKAGLGSLAGMPAPFLGYF
jgi:hypothetical protein